MPRAHVNTDESSAVDLHEDGQSLPRPPAIVSERPSVCADQKRMSNKSAAVKLLFIKKGKTSRPRGTAGQLLEK
jgi:hypothetical protein